MFVTQKIYVDTLRLNTTDIVQGKQGDSSSRYLNAILTENGKRIVIVGDANVYLAVIRPDEQAATFVGEVLQDGSVMIEIPDWVLEVPGRCSCSISVASEGRTLTSLSFILNVQPAEWSNSWIVVHIPTIEGIDPGTYYIELPGRAYSFTTTEPIPINGAIAFNKTFTEAATFSNILMSNESKIEGGILLSSTRDGKRIERNSQTIFGSIIDELERVFGEADEAIAREEELLDELETGETARRTAEQSRLNSETLREEAEGARVRNETARQQNETERQAAEDQRQRDRRIVNGGGQYAIAQKTESPGDQNTIDGDNAAGFGLSNTVTENGEHGFVEGHNNLITNHNGHSEGHGNASRGNAAHSEGEWTEAIGDRSHSEGSSTISFMDTGHSEGFKTRARHESGHSEGRYTEAEGDAGHAEGYGSITGEGQEKLVTWDMNGTTEAIPGFAAHAEGYKSRARKAAGHSEGHGTTSNAVAAHSEGEYTEANGRGSHAGGVHTAANNQGEYAIGRWGKNNQDPDRLFSVGNGTSSRRHNAFEIGGSIGQEYLQLGDVRITVQELEKNYFQNLLYETISPGTCRFVGVQDKNVDMIIIPNTNEKDEEVIEIAPSALLGCNKLKKLRIPFVGAKKDGSDQTRFFGVLFGATRWQENETTVPVSLKEVYIGAGSDTIPESAFRNCRKLETLEMEDGIEIIEDSALSNMDALETLELPDTIREIRSLPVYPFAGRHEWQHGLYFGSRKTPYMILVRFDYQDHAGITELSIHPTCRIICSNAINGYTELESIELPEGLLEIESFSMAGNTSLGTIVIPNTVRKIGNYAFTGCTALQKVVVGHAVEELGVNAFGESNNLVIDLTRCAAVPRLAEITTVGTGATIRVDEVEKYLEADYWIELAEYFVVYSNFEHPDGNEYHIGNAKELLEFARAVNGGNTFNGKTVKLDADIELEGVEWIGIGRIATAPFSGVFDGCGHTIRNLTETVTNPDGNAGLFCYVRASSYSDVVVKNFRLTGSISVLMNNSSNAYVGAVISGVDAVGCNGANRIQVSGIWSSVTINTRTSGNALAEVVGGIVGYVRSSGNTLTLSITDCFWDGWINNGNRVIFCGGILGHTGYNTAGRNVNVEIRRTIVAGRISLNDIYSEDVGMLVGYVKGNGSTGTVDLVAEDCLVIGKMTFYTGDGRTWSTERYYGIVTGEATGKGTATAIRVWYIPFKIGATESDIELFCDPAHTSVVDCGEKTREEAARIPSGDLQTGWSFAGVTEEGAHLPCPRKIEELFGYPSILKL